MDIDKKLNISEYIQLYGSLLTAHQLEMLRLYYDCDISLFEISEQFDISRQAVRDAIVRGEKALCEYEKKLHIKQSNDNLKLNLVKVSNLISANDNCKAQDVLQYIIEKMED